MSPPAAVVMNLFYTGIGIARSLGEQGVRVIGLTSQRGVYGNFSRYSETMHCPDSRQEPEALFTWLLDLGRRLGGKSILFPTRDHDLVFIDRYRSQLGDFFIPVAPASDALHTCLDKWDTFTAAQRAGVRTPQCWRIHSEAELREVAASLKYPCVMKPVAAWHWREAGAWAAVGERKAMSVSSREELFAEYALVSKVSRTALLQEMIPGTDDNLVIAACYMDRESRCLAMFNTQKLVQVPEGFGTGCIVAGTHRPELYERTVRLLQNMRFSGIAEVEYKWDATVGDYQLIEVNPRPWDQHRLGNACGVDLMHVAYCDLAGKPLPAVSAGAPENCRWIAEDVFVTTALRCAWHRNGSLRPFLAAAAGKRIYGIWSMRDPIPFLVYMLGGYAPRLMADVARWIWSAACSYRTQRSEAPQRHSA